MQTEPAPARRFEAHKRYIDIQYLAAGTEVIEHARTGELRPADPFDTTKDLGFFQEPAAATRLHLEPGMFAIFFPEDAHKPCCAAGAPASVRKVVLKVEVA